MSKNTLTNLALRNQFLLDQYKAGQVLDFDKVHKKLEAAIQETLGAVEGETLDTLSRAELNGVLRDLNLAQTDIKLAQIAKLTESLADLAGFTASTEASTLKALTKAAKAKVKIAQATAKQAYAAALANPMNVGREATGVTLNSFIKGWADATTNMVNGAVLQGWQQGKTVQQVMQQIRGTKAALYKDGLTAASRRDAASMVRTATQHVAQTARMETWAANGDLVQGYSILATLDGRTTQICRSLDGRKYPLDGKGPVPPFHVGCRTTTVPDLGPEFDFLDEGATRSSANGYVDADLTYYDWMKTQDPAFAKEVLGASRAKLLLEGGMTSKEFGDLNIGKNFEPRTLAEMAAARPSVFRGTGLEKFIPDGTELLGELPEVKVATPVGLPKREVVKLVPTPDTNIFSSQQELDDYWYEYDNALEVNEYLEGYGVDHSEELLEAAFRLDELTKDRSKYKTVYRGMAIESEEAFEALFQEGASFTSPRIASAATNRQLADMYTDPQFIGADEGVRVILEYRDPKGVRGHLSKAEGWDGQEAEVVLPRNTPYRVVKWEPTTINPNSKGVGDPGYKVILEPIKPLP